jgi:hypothetical protein
MEPFASVGLQSRLKLRKKDWTLKSSGQNELVTLQRLLSAYENEMTLTWLSRSVVMER